MKEKENDRCPECGGEVRLESYSFGNFWGCSNEKCDFSCSADDMGDAFSVEKYRELEIERDLDAIVNEIFGEDGNCMKEV